MLPWGVCLRKHLDIFCKLCFQLSYNILWPDTCGNKIWKKKENFSQEKMCAMSKGLTLQLFIMIHLFHASLKARILAQAWTDATMCVPLFHACLLSKAVWWQICIALHFAFLTFLSAIFKVYNARISLSTCLMWEKKQHSTNQKTQKLKAWASIVPRAHTVSCPSYGCLVSSKSIGNDIEAPEQ